MTRAITRAIRLTDGSYLIPGPCCRPAQCAPSRGTRCCLSARCDCAFPPMEIGWAPARPTGRRLNPYVTGAVTVCVAGWFAWVIIVHWLTVLACLFLAVAGAGLIRSRRRRSCSTTVTVIHRH